MVPLMMSLTHVNPCAFDYVNSISPKIPSSELRPGDSLITFTNRYLLFFWRLRSSVSIQILRTPLHRMGESIQTPHEPSSRLPVPSSTTPYWRGHPLPLDDYRSKPILTENVDIAIIGGGMAGACTAYHILKNNPHPPSMVILEARQACSGATGRNGGHTKVAPVALASFHAARGAEAAAEFAAFIKTVIHEMKACVELENIDCDFFLTRSFDVFMDEVLYNDTEQHLKRLRKEGVEWMEDVQILQREYLAGLTGIAQAKGAISCPAASFWPYKFVLGLLEKCLSMGATLQTHTPVTKVTREEESGFTSLQTPRGIIKARKVVFATNAYVSALLPQFADVIVPGRGTACHITTKDLPDMPHLTHTYNIYQSPESREYLVPRLDGSIILGGGQILYRDHKELWYDSVDDSTLIELPDGSDVKSRYFAGYMSKHFSSWRNVSKEVENIDYNWTGIMGYTPDGFPHIGGVPGEEGWFILAGFNGSGMASIFEAARGIASMLIDGRRIEDTHIPKIFHASEERLASHSFK
jgi:glycine/D-amino acid oxidase-like deaminating enzyme